MITFVTAGDPTLDATIKIVKEMETKGADIIELGIPYSDPIAEGPLIQRANERALKNDINLKKIMDTVKEIRKDVEVPIVYLLYYNCILQYGADRFFNDCKESGVDGIIVPDLPFEAQGEITDYTLDYPVDLISLVTPVSRERIENISKNARGFLYCVSSLGVTGMRNGFDTDFEEFFSYINKYTSVPTAIGFGISTPEHVKNLKKYSDGLIVGSAIVKIIEAGGSDAVKAVGEFVSDLRRALDEE